MLSVSILRDPAGAPLYYIAQIEDITERKRIEKELKAANAFLDAIIENIPLMLFIKESASLRFVRFNRAGEDLLGWPKETLIGKNDYDFWPREQAEFFIEKDRETLKSGKVVDIDGRTDPNAPSRRSHPAHEKSSDPRSVRVTRSICSGSRRTSPSEGGSKRNGTFWPRSSVALSASLDYEQTLATVARAGRSEVSPTGVPLM